MAHICIVRHGQTDWNLKGKLQGQTDIPLNETGRKQAGECREFLKDMDWDVVVTTSLKRAKETAEIINESLGLPLLEMDQFKERSFGEGEGMTREAREEKYPGFQFPGMETREELHDRIEDGLQQILKQFPGKKVLLVSHGAVIHAMINRYHVDGDKLEEFRLFNGCLTNLSFEDEGWNVHDYNVTDHLVETKG
ncbi:histidine phosphatase family protein [Rossellomorea aquimaris]|uniref:histidine phosphatase family protein n=1 Tax=Rossellomorea aquimaris TaxID=189382 RepID=UPI001CD1A7AB|nr:histidine phosphatase family protein [Rossellomorea aquimaris]MCA1054433.1 histidine phosphatase family protein [Rossellomorea aquimaris]